MNTLGGIIGIIILYVLCKYPEWRADRSMPPEGYKTDWQRMNMDRIRGMSEREINNKLADGGYDILS